MKPSFGDVIQIYKNTEKGLTICVGNCIKSRAKLNS